MKKILQQRVTDLTPVGFIAAIALVALLTYSGVDYALGAFSDRVNVNYDGGGGGGDYYVAEDTYIPEITPPEGATVEITTFTNGVASESPYSWNYQLNAQLWYGWNGGTVDDYVSGYFTAIVQPNITISYDICIFAADTNERIT